MQKTLPNGHTSCLSSQFKYTPASHTDLGKTFARIKRRLKGESERMGECIPAAQDFPSASAQPLLNRSR